MASILLADDDADFRATLRENLERIGHTVVEASDGILALRALEAAPFDLLILDIVMPDKDGLETLMELRTKDKRLKVLAISGGGRFDSFDHLRNARLMGARATLTKPFTMDHLRETLDSLNLRSSTK